MKYYKVNGGIIATSQEIEGVEIEQTRYDELKEQLKLPVWTQERFEASERKRPLRLEEVFYILAKAQINTIKVDDQTSLRMLDYYPTFEESISKTVSLGYKFTYQGKLYKVIQASLTITDIYLPGVGTESLYARIDEEHDGDIYDPIPYEGNMTLENGKYYTQDNVVYLCNRDTVNPVHNALSELVGLYVEVVNI